MSNLNNLEQLKKSLTIVKLSFDLTRVCNPSYKINDIEIFNIQALQELEKENPDEEKIKELLEKMENELKLTPKPTPNFSSGGYINNSKNTNQ